MDIVFQVSKPANLFHIVDSISLWDESHRRPDIRNWYEELFGISEKDKLFIGKYTSIRRIYGWEQLDSDFIPSKNYPQALSKARKRLKPSEFKVLCEVMKHFSGNAGIMYSHTRPKLIHRKKSLEIEIQNHRLQNLFEDAAFFYGVKYYPKKVIAHLLVNTYDASAVGRANVEPRTHITIEPHCLGDKYIGYLLADIDVLTHEVIHLIEKCTGPYNSKKYFDLIKRKGIQKIEEEILKEAIITTLAPCGVLSVRYGLADEPQVLKGTNIQITPPTDKGNNRKYLFDFRHKLAAHLYELTLSNLERENSIFNDDYLEKAIDALISLRP